MPGPLLDILCIVVTLVSFAVLIAFTAACEKL